MFAAAGAKTPVADGAGGFESECGENSFPVCSAVLLDQQFCYRRAVEQNAVAKTAP